MPEDGQVVWEVEDPSEFRPDLPKDIGKDKSEFRIYDEVSNLYVAVDQSYAAVLNLPELTTLPNRASHLPSSEHTPNRGVSYWTGKCVHGELCFLAPPS